MQARNLLRKSSFEYALSNGYNISCTVLGVQSVRWRKPRWLPMAKSKIFRVPERPVVIKAEAEEMFRLNTNYKTQMKSTLRFLREEVARKKELLEQSFTPTDEEAEFEKCLEINAKWNAEIAQIREKRIEAEREQRFIYIQERLQLQDQKQAEMQAKFEESVKKQKELAPTFITRENIDKAIENALAGKADYTFAIDLQGNIIKKESESGEQARDKSN